MTDKLDPAEVLRRLNGCIGSDKPGHITHDAAALIRQMQAAMVEADRLLAFVVPAASCYSEVADARRSLAPYLPNVDPLVEVLGEFGFHDGAVEAFRATIAKRGGTITWKDGV